MLYLKSLTLSRFKSFKHSELLFSKGFTCVVGPNGSGKSNICDALLFGLGEGSLHRLRVNRLESLISSAASKGEDGMRKAYVRIELGGDESVTVLKAVRSDGKSLYRVNGKRMTKQETIDLLSRHGVHADETNTITQGEISRLVDLNPRERRELIDIASGVEEFEQKKAEAMKELERVGQRISECQIMLNERLGFLNELAAEKDAAERFLEMSSRLKAINYSVLVAKKAEASASLSEQTKAMAIVDSKKNELSHRVETLSKRIEQLNAERQSLTKGLGESAKAMGEINSRLEGIKLELATIELSSSNQLSTISEAEKAINELDSEARKAAERIGENQAEVERLSDRIQELEKETSRGRIRKEESASGEEVELLDRAAKRAESELSEVQTRVAELRADLSLQSSRKEAKLKELQELGSLIDLMAGEREKLLGRLKTAGLGLKSLREGSLAKAAELERLRLEILRLDEQTLRLKEQRAISQQRGSQAYDKLREAFKKNDGLYGRVSELCAYKPEHAYAVEVAAGSRFEYVVVDSIETANRMIDYLKESKAGRATFIPLKELRHEADASGKEEDARQVMDVIRFDPELRKVFSYVFSNTYLVENIRRAKRIGIGKHRYVTPSGELVEQSGILSGGSLSKRPSLTQIESQINGLSERSLELKRGYESKSESLLNARKEEAYAEMEIKSVEKEISELEALSKVQSDSHDLRRDELKEIEGTLSRSRSGLSELEEKRAGIAEGLERARESLSNAYKSTVERSRKLSEYGLSKEEYERLEALRKELEERRIRRAELQKEDEMLGQRMTELQKGLKEKRQAINTARKTMRQNDERRAASEAAKEGVEKEIMSGGDSSRRIYGRLNEVDGEMAGATVEHGRLSNEHSNVERQLTELRMRRGQTETRMNDLDAELSAYREEITPVKGEMAEMEKEAIVLNAKISELGNVNLKAPEIYEEKRGAVDDAAEKVKTLEIERHAVLRMIEEIDSKKLQTFMNTLNEIAKNFTKLYSYIFTGSASIRLDDPMEPFGSGLEIAVSNGKATKLLSSMSGGEKSLISLILVFAIHMCKPSSLYIFDEVDSALDKENSKKLSQLIREMSRNAQFIVVSHNDSLIVDADTAIGVMMSNNESKAIGIEISSIVNRTR